MAYQIPCAESCIDFINRFCYTYDPRKKEDKVIPFELYKKQEDFIRWLWDRYNNKEDGVVDKCRDVGATWCVMAFFVWLIIFFKNVSLGVYTYKGDECHKLGDTSTLLEKAIFIIRYLPHQFKSGIESKHMSIQNNLTGSDISGSSGDNPGRGERRSIFFKDECAFYPHAELIEASTLETSDCKIDVSTHKGTDTVFYNKVNSGSILVFEFDWWDVPGHTQEWYNKKRQDAEDQGLLHVFRREIDRDAAGSIESVIIPSVWVNSARRHKIKKTGRIIAAMDVADEGKDTNALCVIDGNCPIFVDEIGGFDPGDATDRFFWKAVKLKADEFRYDCIGVGAGVKVRLKEIIANLPDDHPAKKIKLIGWSAASDVMRPKEMEFQDTINEKLFENAKAQAWWKAREEFRHTCRYTEKKDHDESKIVNLSEIEKTQKGKKLRLQLSQPQLSLSSRGKIIIKKKPGGTKSPNLADAYIIARAEVKSWLKWESF